MANKKSTPAGNARSAITGRYVSKNYANKNPRTTVVEKPTKPTKKK